MVGLKKISRHCPICGEEMEFTRGTFTVRSQVILVACIFMEVFTAYFFIGDDIVDTNEYLRAAAISILSFFVAITVLMWYGLNFYHLVCVRCNLPIEYAEK